MVMRLKNQENSSKSDRILLQHAMNAAMINYLAGVAGGVAVVLTGHPFDAQKLEYRRLH